MPIRFATSFRRSGAALLLASALLSGACTAPRSIITSGKVTPKGEFRAGYNLGFNIASAPIAQASSAVKQAASQAANEQKVNYTEATTQLQAAALAYVLDPVQTTSDLFIRYGIAPRLDAGYKYTFGSHVFDAQYQLLGPTGSIENPGAGAASGTLYASVGLQFASQRAKLPSLPFLSDINSVLNLHATRYDILVPLTFSNSLGTEEEIGAISYGVAYGHTWMTYGFAPTKVYNGSVQVPSLPDQSRSFSSFGGFVNLKIGYRYVYFVPAVSLFYQNYGDFALLNNNSVSLKGVTVIPSLGLQLRLPNLMK
ncbi:hypothetical protein GCM10022409_11720 [Hymenobacter glaciei]|uniref:Outer membrane protein beta-barrel domain-containing protein n=1 Tax=Hymenobacter glaciei TaxID=877209 RepID=A0ABP7TPE3_9BACT